jgi:hypothetical protein
MPLIIAERPTLREASRESVEAFINHLAEN